MELNAEQIKKVLEHCANWTAETGCKGCPYEENCIDKDVMKDAFALINELTEENERIKLKYKCTCDQVDSLKSILDYDTKTITEDTVKKMQEMLLEQFPHYNGKVYGAIGADTVNWVTKLMLEGL